MIRLEKRDVDEPARLGRIAEAANMTPEQFRQRFAAVATDGDSRAYPDLFCELSNKKTEAPPCWNTNGNLCLGGGCRSPKGELRPAAYRVVRRRMK